MTSNSPSYHRRFSRTRRMWIMVMLFLFEFAVTPASHGQITTFQDSSHNRPRYVATEIHPLARFNGVDEQLQGVENISFCDAVPDPLPKNTPLPNYSPLLCFAYSGLGQELYTLKAYLVEMQTGQGYCASGQWCGDTSNPPAVFSIDNRAGNKSTGDIVEVRNTDVFGYSGFVWVIELYNQASTKVAGPVTHLASSTTNTAPVLNHIGDKIGSVCQPMEFIISASDQDGDAVSFTAQYTPPGDLPQDNLPPGATFDPATRKFSWPCPVTGTYPMLFKAIQTGAIPLRDAELVTIQIDSPQQVLALSSDSYRTGEAGPTVVIVNRTGGSAGTATVQYSTEGITATTGSDYISTSGTLTFAPSETSKALIIPIVNDPMVEADETFKVSLCCSNGAHLGTPSTATVTIVDDDTPSVAGQWSSVLPWPTVPIHMSLLPTGKLMFWDRHDDTRGWDGSPRLWDPATNTFSTAALPGYDLFCSGHGFLADGRLFISGGHIPMPPAPVDSGVGEDKASIYDPFTNSWTRLPNMNAGRWYPSNVTLANGNVLVLAGTTVNVNTVNTVPQVLQTASNTWRNLTSAQQGNFPNWADFYPFAYLAPNGKVFVAGPQQIARYLDTSGTGAWTDVASSSMPYRDYGSSVMYDDGKVLLVGGNSRDPNPNAPTLLPSASAESIDLNDAVPTWRQITSLSVGRRHLITTLLPDGTVLATGGSSLPGFDNPAGAVFYAELWNPGTDQWTPVAGYSRYRGYHSTALLLPDGRVLIGGGGHPDPVGGTEEKNVEIYSPPYLFKGARPAITAAPIKAKYGQSFFVQTPDAANITHVNWIRLSSVTHAFNQSQRINHLNFSQAAGGLTVTAPADPNLSPPGDYMLFILNSSGVPSVAHIIRVGANEAPIAVDDTPTTTEDTPSTLSVLDNDTAPDGNTLAVVAVGTPTHGTATTNSTTVTYMPPPNFNGTAVFTYTMSDGALTDTATVTVAVTPVNDTPSFTKGVDQTMLEDAGPQYVSNWATNILAGPNDETSQALDFMVSNNNTALFTVQPAISPDGTLTYTPAANASGSATVMVLLRDNGGTANGGRDTSAQQTFTITVTPVNDNPTISKIPNQIICGSVLTRTFTFMVGDVDGDNLNVAGSSSNTTLVLNSGISFGGRGLNRTVTITRMAALTGAATITVTVSDGSGGTATETFDVSVTSKCIVSLPSIIR